MEFGGNKSTKSLRDCCPISVAGEASPAADDLGLRGSFRSALMARPESAKADFVLLLPRIHSPGGAGLPASGAVLAPAVYDQASHIHRHPTEPWETGCASGPPPRCCSASP